MTLLLLFAVNLRDGRPGMHSPLYKKRGC